MWARAAFNHVIRLPGNRPAATLLILYSRHPDGDQMLAAWMSPLPAVCRRLMISIAAPGVGIVCKNMVNSPLSLMRHALGPGTGCNVRQISYRRPFVAAGPSRSPAAFLNLTHFQEQVPRWLSLKEKLARRAEGCAAAMMRSSPKPFMSAPIAVNSSARTICAAHAATTTDARSSLSDSESD